METWEKTIKLEQFISNFTPKDFREPIHVFNFAPTISDDNYKYFKASFKKGTLENDLKFYSDWAFGSVPVYRFNKPYIISAIVEYFKTIGE